MNNKVKLKVTAFESRLILMAVHAVIDSSRGSSVDDINETLAKIAFVERFVELAKKLEDQIEKKS